MYTPRESVQRAPRRSARLRLVGIAIATAAASASFIGTMHVDAAESGLSAPAPVDAARSAAAYDGRVIDLAKDWEGAQACWVDEIGAATCFRSEAQMDQALVAAGKDLAQTNPSSAADKREGARAATCSSSLRLYRNNYYGGGVLYLSQRYSWINMSWYGFDNVVSSYRVGGCSAKFRSGSNGGGNTYWGATWAWASKSSMNGWNNVLSSVKIS